MGQIASLIESADFFPPPPLFTPLVGIRRARLGGVTDIFDHGKSIIRIYRDMRACRVKELIANIGTIFGAAEICFRFSIS